MVRELRRTLVILAGAMLAASPAILDSTRQASAYTPHEPILIDGNADFIPANGVTGGSGSQMDPYIIEGWEINASTAHGVEIRNTDSHFVIRNVLASSWNWAHDGIRFFNVTHGTVRNATVSHASTGVRIDSSTDVTIESSNITNCVEGVQPASSSEVVLNGNDIRLSHFFGILVGGSWNVTIAGNKAFDQPYGVGIWSATGVTMTGNRIWNLDQGITITDSDNVTATRNTIYSIATVAITLESSSDVVVAQNSDCAAVWTCIYVYDSARVRIADNRIADTPEGIVLSSSTDVTVSGNSLTSNGSLTGADGIHGIATENVYVSGNVITSWMGDGIELESCRNVTIESNNVRNNGFGMSTGNGVLISSSANATVQGNTVSGNGFGIRVDSTKDVALLDNEVSANLNSGVKFTLVSQASIAQNNIPGNGAGIDISGSLGVLVHRNNIADNAIQAADDAGPENAWDDGYPGGGNHWSDYTGPDNCSGPAQNVCPDPDGIGDTPRYIDPGTWDRYPLMDPCIPDCPPEPPKMFPARLTGAGLADVQLSWIRSLDDGGGEMDIIVYEVWFSDTFDPWGAGYTLLATLPAGLTSYTHVGAGVGDASSYFYQVWAIDEGNLMTPASEQAAKRAQFVQSGMNLMSTPLGQADWSIETVLQTIPWTRAWTYADGGEGGREWFSYDRGKLWSGFRPLGVEMALWVELDADAWWITAGLGQLETSITLKSGWNLIGYPSLVTRSVSDVLAGVGYQSLEGFTDDPPYNLVRLGAADLMAAGNGYWICVSADTVITLSN